MVPPTKEEVFMSKRRKHTKNKDKKKVKALKDQPNGTKCIDMIFHSQNELIAMFEPGAKKHEDKLQNNGKPLQDRLYCYRTLDMYVDVGCTFCIWVFNEYDCTELPEARQYVPEYLQMRIDQNLSAWTIRLDASALAKLYHCSYVDFGVPLPVRHRGDIVKNFIDEETLERLEEKYPSLAKFCRSCGLRRKELFLLRPEDISVDDRNRVIVYVRRGKGGKQREVTALNNYPLELKKLALENGQDCVFPDLPVDAPIHVWRKLFAQTLYDSCARDPETLSREQRYVCRGDMKGYVFDRLAMWIVSQALGHKRLGVVTTYLKKAIIERKNIALKNAA